MTSLHFDRYSLTTMVQNIQFTIIQQGSRAIYIGAKPLSAYNFQTQPGSAPQVFTVSSIQFLVKGNVKLNFFT